MILRPCSSKAPKTSPPPSVRIIALARLGHKDRCQCRPGAVPERETRNEHQALSLRPSWPPSWAREPSQAFETLDAALKEQPKDSDLAYNAACAFALASEALARTRTRPRASDPGGSGPSACFKAALRSGDCRL